MNKNKKRIADGIIFNVLGLNTLWLWMCSQLFIFTTLIFSRVGNLDIKE
jgi:hypothetical protein